MSKEIWIEKVSKKKQRRSLLEGNFYSDMRASLCNTCFIDFAIAKVTITKTKFKLKE